MAGLNILHSLLGRQCGLDKDDNLVIQGTKLGYGRDGAATTIDLTTLGSGGVLSPTSVVNAKTYGAVGDNTARACCTLI